ncbi:hypothetical protein BU23DRAFT_513831 [Bimuria novae-zelandiae CBS 107.79]|uniref:PH domain-containing protein n=1 Tax=Bimuria novae-zelandiae CBS 107.79 TaxID=1447943 RepID=A0A6A5UW48_9PLEO|nr:hypothetical protein BU23DRAFT_513831 [Bimuria novae-zelandiae CBS 107.79]
MARPKRVLSFMSEWGGNRLHRRNTSAASASASPANPASPAPASPTAANATAREPNASSFSVTSAPRDSQEYSPNPATRNQSESRMSSRPLSMIQTYQPPVMEVSQDTLPELQRIFTFLNSHSNKLYQEGYFLKFHDTDTRGRPAIDRVWQECFAQLAGTILSLWDASELDRVNPDSPTGEIEVVPTFINLTDAAIHMMPSMTLADGKKLENILSVSTAASNKYLFHFNSFNSLTQWTAGIRLAMFEHTSLQEAYTGALIAGKGKQVNNIRTLLDRQRAKYEDWVRVRFGAGTPWRRCWCVVYPPDEKEYVKLQKTQKKKDVYNRTPTVLKGDIKFYDKKKVGKKTRPIATITDAYSCYAIYPQSKQLIDQSTLVKVEGKVTVHSKPEQVTEGFVFIMPESRPAISGFEIMLQFLFPVFDTFALYGRPNKLIADVLDTRGLMFAMPPDRRYGYLEMWDVVSLIHSEGSHQWSERQWRKALKDLTSTRMATMPRTRSKTGTRRNTLQGRTHPPPSRSGTLRFEEPGSLHSQPSTRQPSPTLTEGVEVQAPRRVDSAPPGAFTTPRHQRSVSDQVNSHKQAPSRLAQLENVDDYSAANGQVNGYSKPVDEPEVSDNDPPSPASAGSQLETRDLPEVQMAPAAPLQGPVAVPPSFAHAPGQKPPVHLQHPGTKPDANMDDATLHQLADATGVSVAGAAAAWRSQNGSNGARSGPSESDALQNSYSPDHLFAQGAYNSHSGYAGNRLSTIPASPFVEQDQFVGSPVPYQPSAPSVPEHTVLPQEQAEIGVAQYTRPGSEGSQVQRKPVPGRSSLPLRGDDTRSIRSTTSSTLGSLRNDVIDPEALDRLEYTNRALYKQPSQSSSRYSHDDAISTSTPDYASTIEEEAEPQQPARRMPERPRSGMLKFVGNPDLNPKPEFVVGDAHYKPAAKPVEVSIDIPAIDFGPTYVLDPNAKRPGTSGTMAPGVHESTFSQSKENLATSSSEQKRQSYTGRTTPTMHMRSPSASPSQFLDDRSVAWQPAMIPHSSSNNRKLEPEEWVAQRAAAGPAVTPPAYAHARSKSHTPPISRTHSGDWSHFLPENGPARPPSRPLSRPLSRGAGQVLDQRPKSVLLDQRPTSLSAREQEQVARITNTPLVDLSRDTKKEQKPSSAGLTAYIDHREKEKAAAKANRSTSAMQSEIDRRMQAAQQRQMMEMQHMSHQQAQQQAQQQAHQQAQMGQAMAMTPGGYGTPSMMGTPQGYPQAYAYSTPGQMPQMQQPGYFPQQTMMTPMSGSMPGGWSTPSPGQMPAQYFGQYQNQQLQQQGLQQNQQQPATQPYGASFDQAQAAVRFAHQQRRGY